MRFLSYLLMTLLMLGIFLTSGCGTTPKETPSPVPSVKTNAERLGSVWYFWSFFITDLFINNPPFGLHSITFEHTLRCSANTVLYDGMSIQILFLNS